MKRLPVTGSSRLLDLLDPYIPDDFINEHWNARPVRGPRWQFSAAQLWRVHLLALLTPVHSLNLLSQLLPEQRGVAQVCPVAPSAVRTRRPHPQRLSRPLGRHGPATD